MLLSNEGINGGTSCPVFNTCCDMIYTESMQVGKSRTSWIQRLFKFCFKIPLGI